MKTAVIPTYAHVLALLVALLSIVLTAPVNAQSATANVNTLETVFVTATRVEADRADLTASISAVDQFALEMIGHTHASEALARVPGVWVSRGNGQEHLTAIRSGVLTGPGSCGSFFVAEDGIPLRAPGFCNVNQLFDANTEQAQRLEVIRGPGTAVHGSNAVNGVINVITPAPTQELTGSVGFEFGPHDYHRVRAQASNTQNNHAWLISANASVDNGYLDDAGYDQQKLTARHHYQGDGWRVESLLSGSNLNQETAGFLTGEDAYKNKAIRTRNENPEAYRDTSSGRWYSRFIIDAFGDGQLTITPFARYTDMAFLQHFLPGDPLEENAHHSIGVQTLYTAPFQNGRGDFHSGFDLDATRGELVETQEAASFAVFPTGKHYDYEVDAVNLAWFAGGHWQLTERLQSNAAARWEFQRYSYDNRISDGNDAEDGTTCAGGCRFSRPADRVDEFRNFSANVGLIADLGDGLDGVINLVHGFRAPQATELYRLQAGQSVADLDSEEINSIEFGLRHRGERVRAEITAFYQQKNNVIVRDSDRNNISDGQTRGKGLELSAYWQISESWSLGFDGTFAKHEYSNDVLGAQGNEIDTAPPRIASTRLHWQPTATTLVELEWRHTARYFLDEANLREYEGHDLLNLRIKQQLGQDVYVALRATNITDEDYAERADFGFGEFRYFVGEPARVYGEIGFTF